MVDFSEYIGDFIYPSKFETVLSRKIYLNILQRIDSYINIWEEIDETITEDLLITYSLYENECQEKPQKNVVIDNKPKLNDKGKPIKLKCLTNCNNAMKKSLLYIISSFIYEASKYSNSDVNDCADYRTELFVEFINKNHNCPISPLVINIWEDHKDCYEKYEDNGIKDYIIDAINKNVNCITHDSILQWVGSVCSVFCLMYSDYMSNIIWAKFASLKTSTTCTRESMDSFILQYNKCDILDLIYFEKFNEYRDNLISSTKSSTKVKKIPIKQQDYDDEKMLSDLIPRCPVDVNVDTSSDTGPDADTDPDADADADANVDVSASSE